jgi:hypothetical protein
MNRLVLCFATVFCLIVGCGRPDRVTTVPSPVEGVFYTVETTFGHGPSSDTNRIHAHLRRNGQAKRLLVLEGENLTVTKVNWDGPHDVTVCLDGVITNTFRNVVTLIVGNASETIRNHLHEDCKPASKRDSEQFLGPR